MITVGILGALGRMGREIASEILDSPDIQLRAACARPEALQVGRDYGDALGRSSTGFTITDQPAAVFDVCQVVIDFTTPEFLTSYTEKFMACPKPMVIGTTGLGDDLYQSLKEMAVRAPIFYAENMSLGVALLLRLIRQVSEALPKDYQIEIIDRHHQFKRDAPSGTALQLAHQAALGRNLVLKDVLVTERQATCQARGLDEIGVLSLRGGGLAGQHDVAFIANHEQLTLGHQAFSRQIFAQGALNAARWLIGQKPGFYGMADLL